MCLMKSIKYMNGDLHITDWTGEYICFLMIHDLAD